MKIVIAPDSYKNNMRAQKVTEVIERGLRESLPTAEILQLPMADGGEGTVEALTLATGGTMHTHQVMGPLGNKVDAAFGLSPDQKTAFVEMASASGIELVKRDQLNPMKATTFGTGELIHHLADMGVEEIILGIGGSATVDGGAGMAQALGFHLLKKNRETIPLGAKGLESIQSIDDSEVPDSIKKLKIRIACDVINPLLGPKGAATVYGPQKGATAAMVPKLEEGLSRLAKIWMKKGWVEDVTQPGDGAAGGLGAGLRAFLKGEITSGAALVAEAVGFKKVLENCDVLITGEGQTDGQSAHGKLCGVLSQIASEKGIPTVLLSGAITGDTDLLDRFFWTSFSICSGPGSLEEALSKGEHNLFHTAKQIGRFLAQIE